MKMEEEVHSDDDLVELIRLGDEKAADELIKRYYRSILHYCRNHCFNQEKAEDLTQETFLKLFKNLSGYKGKRRFRAYLYTIANHLCIDESRKTEVYSLDDKEVIEESDEMSRIEDKSEIDYLLNVLSPEQREAVILRFGEELSYREIALVTGCNMRTAQSRVRVSKADLGRSRESCMYDGSYFPGGASSKFIWGNRADGFILPGSLFSLHGEYAVPVPA